MALDQADLFWAILPIEKKFSDSAKLALLDKEIALKNTYNAASVFFLGLEKWEDWYVAKTRFHTQENGSRMYRLYFKIDSTWSVDYTWFWFGTNTHRDPVAWKNYSFDSKQIYSILQEAIDWGFIQIPKVKSVQARTKSASSTILLYSQTCPICKTEKSSDGFNCITCGEYEPEWLWIVEDIDDKKILEFWELADQEVKKSMRLIRGLNFLPNISDIKNGQFIFTNVYINGSNRSRIKVSLLSNWNIKIYSNHNNWTKIFIKDKQKFGQIYAAVQEIKRDFSLAES